MVPKGTHLVAFLVTLVCFALGSAAKVRVASGQEDGGPVDIGQDVEPNPPVWPASVHVFGEEDTDITAKVAEILETANDRISGHYTQERVALLFKPGTYKNVEVFVGYYVQVLGLGEKADDVFFSKEGYHSDNPNSTYKGVHALAMGAKPSPGSLDVFWRSVENFRSDAPELFWAVSQAAPIRRVHAMKDLILHDEEAWASGGFMADMQVDGVTEMGGQQQWFTRNTDMNTPNSTELQGLWNFVFVGTTGAPPDIYPEEFEQGKGLTNVAAAPVIAEKPFITISQDGTYWLQIPKVRQQAVGATLNLSPKEAGSESVPFSKVFVARDTDSASDIQAKLDKGLHVVLAPGVWYLDQSLTIKHDGQVLLGIGMATLTAPTDGSPIVKVLPGVKGVRLAGLMLSASKIQKAAAIDKSTFIDWGDVDVKDDGDVSEPGIMSDIFARVGGPDKDRTTSVDIMVRVNSGNVIGDNLWLWRSDHAVLGDDDEPWPQRMHPKSKEGEEYHLTKLGEHPCDSGLVVNGRDVTMYGLFVEHTVADMTIWNGEGGRVYFYQSELPYDVTQESFCDKGYSGYVVNDNVKSHEGYGVGIYTYFRDHECIVESGIRAPETDGVRFVNIFTRYLNGEAGIRHVLNQKGEANMGTGWWDASVVPQEKWDKALMYRFPNSMPAEPKSLKPEVPARNPLPYVALFVTMVVIAYACCLSQQIKELETSRAAPNVEMGGRATIASGD